MMTTPPPRPIPRRHDLDALRAVAMLLGIVLHSALSFVAFPWLVQDTRQHDGYGTLFHVLHGFRMPLFFVMSGFFTAMLFRRRGLGGLLRHRFRRILCPLCLGLLTIVPLTNWIGGMAIQAAFEPYIAAVTESPSAMNLWHAAGKGDVATLVAGLEAGADINELDPDYGVAPLTWAAIAGEREAVEILIRCGADVNGRNRDRGTALHGAAVMGHADLVQQLVEAGARVNLRNNTGTTPLQATRVDIDTARFVAALFNTELDEASVRPGWEASAGILLAHGAIDVPPADRETNERTDGEKLRAWLMEWPVFHHLWFLWHLCWLVAGFSVLMLLVRALPDWKPPDWLVTSPAHLLWLVPLTMPLQAQMAGYGPDTSIGILPIPHVLGYYAIFFGFGAMYFGYEDPRGRVSRGWWLMLPLALFLVFPLGLHATHHPGVIGEWGTALLHAAFPWLMVFGLMGLFRKLLGRENRTMRYISDSSYWLYLAHLPLVIAGQLWIRDWPLPAGLKFSLLCVAVSAILLISYACLVRYTWVGALLNGRRYRLRSPATPAADPG